MKTTAQTSARPINWKLNLFVVWIGQLVGNCAVSFALPFIPLYLRERFGLVDEVARGSYIAAFEFFGMMSFCISNPIWGALGDRYGRKLMLLRAYFLNGLTIPLMMVAPTPVWLIVVRAVVSCFSGTISASQALVVATTPEEHHGFALGALSTALWSGTVLGLLSGGLIVHFFSYRTAFFSCGAMLLVCGTITLLFARENFVRVPKAPAEGKPAGKRGLFNATVVSLLLFFCLLSLARKMDNPFLPMLVEIIGGVDEAVLNTSYISALAAVGGIISGFLFGALSDRFAPWKLAIPALAVAAGTMFIQANAHTLWMLAAGRFFCYFAAGGVEPVAFALLSRSTDAEHRSAVLGWSASVRVLGSLLGAALSGALISTIHTRGIFCAAGCVMAILIPYCLLILRRRGGK